MVCVDVVSVRSMLGEAVVSHTGNGGEGALALVFLFRRL